MLLRLTQYLKQNHLYFGWSQAANALFSTVAVLTISFFALWWFTPAHIPHNFSGLASAFDILLFLLVSYVIWHPIIMDVLTWMIASHIEKTPKSIPTPGLKVAFITTIVPSSESVDLLHKCLPAMVAADYQHDTWVLDEGNSPEVKAICRLYGVHHFSRLERSEYHTPNGRYTRTKGGNHNAWYEEYGNHYEIVAQIDTDFVPVRTFLTDTLGYFSDPDVAFVGTPQVYGNIDESFIARGAAEQQYSFYGTILQGLSGMGSTLLIGANHIIRVSALKDVGHYSAHITEDLLTGMKLHTNRWKSIYLPSALAIGEGPTTWEAYFNQQMRWAYGCMDILFRHSPKLFSKMDFRRKIYYFLLQQHYFSGIVMAVSILLLALYFLAGLQVATVDLFVFCVVYSSTQLLCWMMSVWLENFHIPREDEGKLLIAGTIISIAVWPIWFLAFLSVLTGKRLSYKVTPKGDQDEAQFSLATFTPHLILAFLAAVCVLSSFFTHRQNPVMLFWAGSSMVLLLSIPFVQTLHRLLTRLHTKVRVLVHTLVTFHGMSPAMNNHVSKQTSVFYDCVFLSTVFLASCIFYIRKLGFYSDDWSFLSNFHFSADQSLWGLIQTATTPNTFMRPVQNVLDALLYWLFGTAPLGYHIVNALILLAITLTFYGVLRRLRVPHILMVTLPLVYILLPQYSTDRFWYASFQVNLSILLYFISLLAGICGFTNSVWKKMFWQALSLVTLVLSTLSYEVALPLFLFNMLVFWNPLKNYMRDASEKFQHRSAFILLTFIVMIYMLIFKARTTVRISDGTFSGLSNPLNIVQIFLDAFQVNFVTLGIQFPFSAWSFFSQYAEPTVIVAGVILGIGIFSYLSSIVTDSKRPFPSAFWMRILLVLSLGIFVLGYAIFATNETVAFSPTGMANRVAMAAALGVAGAIVASVGWLTRYIRSEYVANQVFCLIIALVCATSFVTVNTLSTFWASASRQQEIVLADISQHLPEMESGSTIILDNVCSYVGPASVFESEWDLKGAVQLMYNDSTLQANVVNARLQATTDGIQSQIYDLSALYPYENVFVYNFTTKETYPIHDLESAEYYLGTTREDFKITCPHGEAGKGVDVL